MTAGYVDSSVIRGRFASAMSDMYRREVPMYGTLLDLVGKVNRQVLENHLQVAGYHVFQAANGPEALRIMELYVRRRDPDYVFGVEATLACLGIDGDPADQLQRLRRMLEHHAVQEVTT